MPYGKISKKDILFINIPKTAGKSIKAHLGLPMNCHYPLSWFERDDPERFAYAYKFSFVRNPWDRISSMYRYYKEIERNAYVEKLTFEQFVSDLCLGSGPLFGKGNDTVLKLTQYEYLSTLKNKLEIDFVGKYESLEQDLENLSKILELPKKMLKQNRKVSSNRGIDYRTQYSDKTRELIAEKFEKDIQTWNYTFETETGEER